MIRDLSQRVKQAELDLSAFHDIRRNVLHPLKKCNPDEPVILADAGDFWKSGILLNSELE
jgi:hypothetical protein